MAPSSVWYPFFLNSELVEVHTGSPYILFPPKKSHFQFLFFLPRTPSDLCSLSERMGVCGSKPKGCVGINKLKKKRRRPRRVKKPQSRVEPSHPKGSSEKWFEFDTDPVIDSEGDDEFYSVQDDVSQAGSLSNVVTPRFSNNTTHGSGTESFDDPQNDAKNAASFDKSSSSLFEEENGLHSCGFISNALIPRLACDESLDGRRKQPSVGGPSTKKRLSITHSSKFKGQDNPISPLGKSNVRRPIAGSQIMCSPLEKKMSDSWSRIEPSIFKVRGRNYIKDKKKELAPNYAAYVPFGVDVFLSPRKIDHIARFVELPAIDSHGEVPSLLVVNLQIPLYPATLFQNEYDGAGVSFVFYFKLSENYSQDLPLHFRENIKRIIANETEKIKGFPMDTNSSFRERLKILGRVVNLEDLQLSGAERKLIHAYNEKPVLSRPQHDFYMGENYFEMDLDIHRFNYIARKGFETFHDRIKYCVFDFGLTIQGNKVEDLPECMLCCLRLKEIDYMNCCQLSI